MTVKGSTFNMKQHMLRDMNAFSELRNGQKITFLVLWGRS